MSSPQIHGAAAAEADVLIYGVHGRGQSPEFIRDLAERIGELHRFSWIMPAAPGNTWYPEGFMAPTERNEPALAAALGTMDTQLAELVGGAKPVVALGFSQGACLLAEHLLNAQPKVAAMILHTGGYLGPEPRNFPRQPGWEATPALLLTARADPWVPLHRSEETAQALADAGATVDLRIYEDTEHHINDDAVAEIRELLAQVATTHHR
ncbi:alpha/beta hydrolase [Corynebacterium sp. A21]|uniref:alpha/beta hydrolase n=1 Tax=Corynebacterium sp. A21 TaxID=3457318 RepID=UPI003FD2D557